MNSAVKLHDKPKSYGWISIILHWFSAIAIITLWFLGDSMRTTSELSLNETRQLHISLALTVYLVLLFRIIWRLKSSHPWVKGQGKHSHKISMLAHYSMLLCLSVMLLTGPLMLWASGTELNILNWFTIVSPLNTNTTLAETAKQVHGLAGDCLISIALLHICGACKHLMFNDDETFIRILFPAKK